MKYSIEDLYQQGGYEFIYAKYGFKRMPKASRYSMTEKSYRRWKLYLRWRWMSQHPDYAKEQNKYYNKLYQKTKPCVCICINCGKEFNAPRKYYKICPECHKIPTKHELYVKEMAKRRKERQEMIEEVKYWYSKGETQEVLAEDFGVTQKTISNWVRKK